MYVLHSLQGHVSGFHDLINFLNSLKELLYLIYLAQALRLLGQDILQTVSHNEQFLYFLS